MEASTGRVSITLWSSSIASGQIVADLAIEHTADGWQRWREQVSAFGDLRPRQRVGCRGGAHPQQESAGAHPHPVAGACTKARSRPTAPTSRSSLRNIPITISLVRCPEPVQRSPHACWAKSAPIAPALMIQTLDRLWPRPLRFATNPVRSIKSICGDTATSRCGPPSICGPTSVDTPLPGPSSMTKPFAPAANPLPAPCVP